MTESHPHALFSFGALLDQQVQTALFGRTVPTTAASLAGYTTRPIAVTDESVIATSGQDVHLTLARKLGGTVEGAVLRLSDQELAAADDYEVADYARRRVLLASGETAWAYLDARPLRSAARIVIVGDSIAYGRCDPQGGWAGHLAAAHIGANETEHRVFNLAVPGSTLADVSEQTPALLPPRHPDTLVVAAGINDSAVPHATSDTDPDGLTTLAGHLDSLASTAQRHNARLVVLGPIWLDETRTGDFEGLRFTTARARALRAALQTWCADHHVDYLDLWEPLRDQPHLLVDGLHPSTEGHKELYRYLTALNG
ncbi:GDSL-type esterase/lipase family protein [Kitasatospora sp. NPDC049285]|uniref:GDSL-type esterase/lipase family protein n=1 Tax=Kitasatospora sp. NPDC049285 TaxID=3157096 RepID=UPI0034487C57